MPEVNSSAVERLDYDVSGRALYVTFQSGRVYRYDAVPYPLYERFLAAESKGAFLNRFVRDRYPATRVTARPAPVRLSPA